ncbi:InlB B-repeat-containing protein [Rhodoferax antarcticus]|uniref:InlB B-repeat-containing protein n=1 Tax=Rhodoferax antarcticus TaxID=81479 RepID=UPI0022253F34|nr:tellurite resistance TerB C-terminal domain-containing protein [Rhodoferax antarcticus]MCW2311313.1 hypothetical protein [Rhodoferax antarcticus]
MYPIKSIVTDAQLVKQSKQDLHAKAVERVEKELLEKESEYQELLAKPSLEGDKWGDLISMARHKYGTHYWVKEVMGGGKMGMVAYLEAVRSDASAKLTHSQNEQEKSRLIQILFAVDMEIAQTTRLVEAARLARHNAVEPAGTEFTPLQSFALSIGTAGTGSGHVMRSVSTSTCFFGNKITLKAQAEKGSIFKRWSGDAAGAEEIFILTMDSVKSVTAEFLKIKTFDMNGKLVATEARSIDENFDVKQNAPITKLDDISASHFLALKNGRYRPFLRDIDERLNVGLRAGLAFTIKTAMTVIIDGKAHAPESIGDKVNKKGIEAVGVWLHAPFSMDSKGAITHKDLPKGLTKHLLVFDAWKSSASLHANVNGVQEFETNLADDAPRTAAIKLDDATTLELGDESTFGTLNAIDFQTTGAASAVSNSKARMATTGAAEAWPVMAHILQRIESLEFELAAVQRRLDSVGHEPLLGIAPSGEISAQSLLDVLTWLASRDRVAAAELRARLLPLNLLPGAVIDEINERALDLIGELALEEVGNEIVVTKEIFEEVLANWKSNLS